MHVTVHPLDTTLCIALCTPCTVGHLRVINTAFIAQCLSISQCSTMHVLIAPYKLCANVPLFIHLYTILSGKIKWQVLRNLLDIFEVDSQRIILLPLLKIIKKDFTDDVNVNATKWFGVII